MSVSDRLLDAFLAGVTFGGTWYLAQLLTPHLPGVVAWGFSGALVCLTEGLVVDLVFGSAGDDDEDSDAE